MNEENGSTTVQSLPISISERLGHLQFHKSGKFRVLQIADIQEGPKVSKDTITLLASACDTVHPDIVIFTGNQIAGYDSGFAATYRSRRWDTPQDGVYAAGQTKVVQGHVSPETSAEDLHQRLVDMITTQAQQFLQPLIDRGIPFAITYGNHDFQCGLDTPELDDIYRQFPGCLNPTLNQNKDRTVPMSVPISGMPQQLAYACEPGTFALPVMSENGSEVLVGLVLVNSGDYDPQGGYGAPSKCALTWLKTVSDQIGSKSLVFQHFPMQQMYQLMRSVTPTTAYAIQGYRTFDHEHYVLDPEKTQPGGYLGEGISCPDHDTGEFDILANSGGYLGLFAGHDHRNAYVGLYDGLILGSTPTSGFGSYGPPASQRAVRYFEFDQRHPSQPRTTLLEFGTIAGVASSRSVYTFAMSQVPPTSRSTTMQEKENTNLSPLDQTIEVKASGSQTDATPSTQNGRLATPQRIGRKQKHAVPPSGSAIGEVPSHQGLLREVVVALSEVSKALHQRKRNRLHRINTEKRHN